jgi:hypothetical protein
VAGVLLGLVSIKPHYFVLLPVALAAARAWRALGICVATALFLVLVSVLRFGLEPWAYWLTNSTGPTQILARGFGAIGLSVGSVFASVRTMGGSPQLAWTLQGVAMLVAAATVALVFRRPTRASQRLLVIAAATLLFAPYWLPYDLFLASTAIALAIADRNRPAASRGEMAVWGTMWMLPALMVWARVSLDIPITIPIIVAMLAYSLDEGNAATVNHGPVAHPSP